MPDSYKVMRAFQRHDGKALRTFSRGSIISAKDAAKMDIKDPKKYPRGNPLQTLIRSGAIYLMPNESIVLTLSVTPTEIKEGIPHGGRPS